VAAASLIAITPRIPSGPSDGRPEPQEGGPRD